ncbi:hypothetical protein QU721_11750 [Klebsiella pneumoniae]|nr:hypothetical protein QU721_11750 [Klebsiella pneumoniae]
MITVYGVPGWGSTISELMLSLADIPYEVVDVEGFDQPGPARERLRQINPLCQVPTLQLAAGPWALGASVTLLDCYIAAMYRWGPRQAWFDDHAPKFAAIARAVCQRPELAAALRRNKLI